jgi:hypothetical protein
VERHSRSSALVELETLSFRDNQIFVYGNFSQLTEDEALPLMRQVLLEHSRVPEKMNRQQQHPLRLLLNSLPAVSDLSVVAFADLLPRAIELCDRAVVAGLSREPRFRQLSKETLTAIFSAAATAGHNRGLLVLASCAPSGHLSSDMLAALLGSIRAAAPVHEDEGAYTKRVVQLCSSWLADPRIEHDSTSICKWLMPVLVEALQAGQHSKLRRLLKLQGVKGAISTQLPVLLKAAEQHSCTAGAAPGHLHCSAGCSTQAVVSLLMQCGIWRSSNAEDRLLGLLPLLLPSLDLQQPRSCCRQLVCPGGKQKARQLLPLTCGCYCMEMMQTLCRAVLQQCKQAQVC